MGGKKPLRRPLWPPTRATASNYYPLGLDGAGGAAKPLLRAPKKPAPLHGRLPAFSGAVDAFERARKCFLEWRYFFSIILSEFLKNRVALQQEELTFNFRIIMLLDKEYEPDEEKRIDKAFRHMGENPDDEARFDSYVRGGVDVLYEKLIEGASSPDDYVSRLYDFVEEFQERFNEDIASDEILKLCSK